MPTPKVIVIQDGGRLHYAIPLALHNAGMLSRVYTDYYARRASLAGIASRILRPLKPQLARRMMARRNDSLPDAKVSSNLPLTLGMSRRKRFYPSNEAYWEAFALEMKNWVLRKGFQDATAIMGFIRSIHPSLAAAAKNAGLKFVGDQMIAPMPIEQAEAALQQQRFPHWQSDEASDAWKIMDRLEKQSWPLADHITCASDYVKGGLLSQGIAPSRISVLPYPIDASHFPVTPRQNRPGPITVGFVGAVGLRKGAPYFFQVANRLASPHLPFVMVGPIHINPALAKQHASKVNLIGSVPRPEVQNWLAKFDILLFPSTCEGSAGSVMEAMASALPIVTSPNSGSVVQDAIQGFIRPYDNIEALATCIETLATTPTLRQEMSQASRLRAEQFNLTDYSTRLASLFTTL